MRRGIGLLAVALAGVVSIALVFSSQSSSLPFGHPRHLPSASSPPPPPLPPLSLLIPLSSSFSSSTPSLASSLQAMPSRLSSSSAASPLKARANARLRSGDLSTHLFCSPALQRRHLAPRASLRDRLPFFKRDNRENPAKTDDTKGGSRRIVLCLDSSENSVRALDWCINKLFSRSDEVTLLHVFDFRPIAVPLDPRENEPESFMENRQMELKGEQAAIRMMRLFQKRCLEAGVLSKAPEIAVVKGSSKNEICKYAENQDADLLVLASRGLGRVKRLLLGSVSGYCVFNCKVPVLVVKDEHRPTRKPEADKDEVKNIDAELDALGYGGELM